MQNIHEAIVAISQGLSGSWFETFLFRNTLLGNFLLRSTAQESTRSSYNFINIYLNSSWFFRWWFKSYIKDYNLNHDFNLLTKSLGFLKANKLFNEGNFKIVNNHRHSLKLCILINKLNRASILTKNNLEVLVKHPNPEKLYTIFQDLFDTHLGSRNGRNRNILTQSIFNFILGYTNIDLLQRVTEAMRWDFLPVENLNAILNHINPMNAVEALRILQSGDGGILFTPEYCNIVLRHTNPSNLAKALCELKSHDSASYVSIEMFTPENRDALIGHTNPYALYNVLLRTWDHYPILTPDIRTAVISHPYPDMLINVIDQMNYAQILTQDNYNALLSPEHQVLLSPNMRQVIWSRLRYIEVRDNWVHILEASRNPNPEQALTTLTNQILGIVHFVGNNPVNAEINDRQSTHTASVHRSVSESATRLFVRYGAHLDGINLDKIIATINAWAHALPAGIVNDAAKRCIKRLSSPYYTYSDYGSDVSTRLLLALSWLAIHDEAHRQGSLSDALRQFCEGLYESQRGYNLSEEGVDEGGVDDPICTAGTFNKLVEKLEGIHPDVIIKLITPKIAGLKLSPVVKEEVNRYLAERTNPTTAAGFVSITARLKQIEEEGVSAIWGSIKENVSTRMFEEFGSLYINKEDERFAGLVDAGQYVNMGQLPSFQKILSESDGYRKYCSATMKSYGAFFTDSSMMFDHDDQHNFGENTQKYEASK